MKPLAQTLDVLPVQFPLAAQHLGNDAARSKHIHQILLPQSVLVHQKSQNFYRLCARQFVAFGLEVFDQQCQKLRKFLFGASQLCVALVEFVQRLGIFPIRFSVRITFGENFVSNRPYSKSTVRVLICSSLLCRTPRESAHLIIRPAGRAGFQPRHKKNSESCSDRLRCLTCASFRFAAASACAYHARIIATH